MRVVAALCFGLVAALMWGCAATPPRQVASALDDPAPPIDEGTYRAVLGSVYDGLLAEVSALEALDDQSLAQRTLPAPTTTLDLEARTASALRRHRVSSEQMAYFALAHPDVVASVSADNASRMRDVQAAIHRLATRVRARSAQRFIASIAD